MKLAPLVLAIFAQQFCFAQPNKDTVTYLFHSNGKPTGFVKYWKPNDSTWQYAENFMDNNRGYRYTGNYLMKPDGTVSSYTENGERFPGGAYMEHIYFQGDSIVEQKDSIIKKYPAAGRVIYPPFIVLAAALLQAKEQRLVLHNNDTLEIKRMDTVSSFSGNKTIRLKRIQLRGWAMFAELNNMPIGHSRAIRSDYASFIDSLQAIDIRFAAYETRKIFQRLSDTLPKKFAIKNIRVFDAVKASLIPGQNILVSDGRITYVGTKPIPAGYSVIEGKGKTMLPGLWDTHVHYNPTLGKPYIAGGITHIRDMGNVLEIVDYRQQIRNHELIGPDLSVISGFVDYKSGFNSNLGITVSNKKEALNAIDYYHKRGYEQLKIYTSIDSSWVSDMVARAHKYGMRALGHIPWQMKAADCIKKGYDELTHLHAMYFDFFPDSLDRRKDRVRPMGRLSGKVDLQGEKVQQMLNLIKSKKIAVEPTIGVFEMFTESKGDTSAAFKPIVQWLPEKEKSRMIVTRLWDEPEYYPDYKKSLANLTGMVKMLYDKGIPILCGTDGGSQVRYHRELELFVKAGIPASKVLQIATYGAAKSLKLDKQYGQIKAGLMADFILIDGDPVKDISKIRNVFMVVTNHTLYYPKKLYNDEGWGYYY